MSAGDNCDEDVEGQSARKIVYNKHVGEDVEAQQSPLTMRGGNRKSDVIYKSPNNKTNKNDNQK